MAKSLKNAGGKTVVAQVVHAGEDLLIPDRMTIPQAIALLHARLEYEEEVTVVRRTFNVFPWDGAHALVQVMSRKFGWAQSVPTPGFFGSSPPTMVDVKTGVDSSVSVPWGRMSLPGIEGWVCTGSTTVSGRQVFELVSSVRRKNEPLIRELFDAVAAELEVNSIYRGKAVSMRFRDSDGDELESPTVEFIDTRGIDRNTAIYNEDIARALDVSLWAPIERAADCLANGISLKRGILLGGTFGTGKTLGMTVAAALAEKHGLTYVHVQRADELAQAIVFARQYQSPAAVVACEDIDRTTDGERTVEMDDLLNTIDGIDGKSSNVLVILTTNKLENINPAMLRPGRLDAVIEVSPPDASTVERLIRRYLGAALPDNADIGAAGVALAGQIPAVVAEVCKRAKLAQLADQAPGLPVRNLSAGSVVAAAATMRHQLEILARAIAKPAAAPALDEAFAGAVRSAFNGELDGLRGDVKRIRGAVC